MEILYCWLSLLYSLQLLINSVQSPYIEICVCLGPDYWALFEKKCSSQDQSLETPSDHIYSEWGVLAGRKDLEKSIREIQGHRKEGWPHVKILGPNIV